MSQPEPSAPATNEPQPPIGRWRPPRIATLDAPSPSTELAERLRGVTGLSSAFSDALDGVGLATSVPASRLVPLRSGDVLIGRALTLRYLPMRTVGGPSRLAHLTACDTARPGDVLVISAPRDSTSSVLGGLAAAAAVAAGVRGIVVQGAVRDLDEVDATGLMAWASGWTPITGRGRLDSAEINGPVEVFGVQCVAGDVVIADRSGVAFVPNERFEALARVVLGG